MYDIKTINALKTMISDRIVRYSDNIGTVDNEITHAKLCAWDECLKMCNKMRQETLKDAKKQQKEILWKSQLD